LIRVLKEETQDKSNNIDADESAYLYVSVSQIPASGNGLHTAINIYKNEIIAVFKGEILTNAQAKFRAKRNNDKYFINMLDGSVLDSMKVKCFAKYANDAKGFSSGINGLKNNSKITLDDSDNVCLIATRNIKTGEEIFCGYGSKYWKKHSVK